MLGQFFYPCLETQYYHNNTEQWEDSALNLALYEDHGGIRKSLFELNLSACLSVWNNLWKQPMISLWLIPKSLRKSVKYVRSPILFVWSDLV